MAEKYRYRGRCAEQMGHLAGSWAYFYAYSDKDALVEFRRLTGLSRNNGDQIEIQSWDEDFHFWMDID